MRSTRTHFRKVFIATLVMCQFDISSIANSMTFGESADEDQSPAIRVLVSDQGFNNGLACSAVRISENYVLSAAHCFRNFVGSIDFSNLEIGYLVPNFAEAPGIFRDKYNGRDVVVIRRNIETLYFHDSISENFAHLSTYYRLPNVTDLVLIKMKADEHFKGVSDGGARISTFASPAEINLMLAKKTDFVSYGYGVNKRLTEALEEHPFGILQRGKVNVGSFNVDKVVLSSDSKAHLQRGDSGGPTLVYSTSNQSALIGITSSINSMASVYLGIIKHIYEHGNSSYIHEKQEMVVVPGFKICDFSLNDLELAHFKQKCQNIKNLE